MLLDTSGLMCLFDRRDFRHADAQTLYNSAPERLTHSYVFAEFVALADARGVPRAAALDYRPSICWATRRWRSCGWTRRLHRQALELLRTRLDKGWSLGHAVSIVLMQRDRRRRRANHRPPFRASGLPDNCWRNNKRRGSAVTRTAAAARP